MKIGKIENTPLTRGYYRVSPQAIWSFECGDSTTRGLGALHSLIRIRKASSDADKRPSKQPINVVHTYLYSHPVALTTNNLFTGTTLDAHYMGSRKPIYAAHTRVAMYLYIDTHNTSWLCAGVQGFDLSRRDDHFLLSFIAFRSNYFQVSSPLPIYIYLYDIESLDQSVSLSLSLPSFSHLVNFYSNIKKLTRSFWEEMPEVGRIV